jgi:hypothetical protein
LSLGFAKATIVLQRSSPEPFSIGLHEHSERHLGGPSQRRGILASWDARRTPIMDAKAIMRRLKMPRRLRQGDRRLTHRDKDPAQP